MGVLSDVLCVYVGGGAGGLVGGYRMIAFPLAMMLKTDKKNWLCHILIDFYFTMKGI